jgi:hypothetical protein
MAAFDLSGKVKWSVPNYSPVILTSHGSLIAKSASSVEFVRNRRA